VRAMVIDAVEGRLRPVTSSTQPIPQPQPNPNLNLNSRRA